jgi:hypothetical protein
MSLYHVLIHSDEAFQVSNLFGDLGCAHFIDLNQGKLGFELRYFKELQHLEETERLLK